MKGCVFPFGDMEVVLSETQESRVRELIDSGAYGSAAEVIDSALRLLSIPDTIDGLEAKLLEGVRAPRETLESSDFDGIRDRIRVRFES